MTAATVFRGELEFLSNFSAYPVRFEGYQFPTVEHAYQAAKTLDRRQWQQFVHPMCPPGEAKRRGRRLVLRPDWEQVKYTVMCRCLASKFTLTPGLADRLVLTPLDLVETNTWHDNEWGNCMCGRVECVMTPGRNLLGKALMQLRAYVAGHAA